MLSQHRATRWTTACVVSAGSDRGCVSASFVTNRTKRYNRLTAQRASFGVRAVSRTLASDRSGGPRRGTPPARRKTTARTPSGSVRPGGVARRSWIRVVVFFARRRALNTPTAVA